MGPQIGAAGAAHGDLDQDLADARLGDRLLDDAKLLGTEQDSSAHSRGDGGRQGHRRLLADRGASCAVSFETVRTREAASMSGRTSGGAEAMDVFESVRTVLAVRRFQEKQVPDEVIRRIVDSAHLTGSSRNLQPWHFIVVQDKEMLRRLGSMAPSGPYIADAAFAVVVVIEESIFSVSDASRAIQSMV